MELLLLLVLPFLFGHSSGSADDTSDEPEDAADLLTAEGSNAVLAKFATDSPTEEDIPTDIWWDEMVRLDGTAEDDTLDGSAANDLILGGAGNDLITLGEGGNLSWVHAWADPELYATFSQGDDTVIGGSGDDAIEDHDGANSLEGGAGNDFMMAIDNLHLDPVFPEGNLQLDSNVIATSDLLFGGTGNDVFDGDLGDTLTGGDGEDSFYAWVYQLDADPVVITDFSAEDDRLGIQVTPEVISQEAFESGQMPELTTDPATGDITISHSGVDLVILRGPITLTPEQIYERIFVGPYAN